MTALFDGLPDVFIETFGQDVTIQPNGHAPTEIRAIFGNRSDPLLDTSYQEPVLRARSGDIAALSDGDPVTISGVSYVARTFEPDGKGMTTIRLEKT